MTFVKPAEDELKEVRLYTNYSEEKKETDKVEGLKAMTKAW